MMRLKDIMCRRVFFVTPVATIGAAVDFIRSQPLDSLLVVENGTVLGSVEALSLYRHNGDLLVTEVLQPVVIADQESTIGEAVSQMWRLGARQIAVTEAGQLAGYVGPRELLASWSTFCDRLTRLPWQGHMRWWAANQLGTGKEIVLLFLDLDDFGALNKRAGHVMGDRVLSEVGEVIRGCVDNERDALCRYGGDEFAMATIRPLRDAIELAKAIRHAVSNLALEGLDEPVSLSVGIAGGQRTRPRPDTHPWATLDDLINLASRASTRAKDMDDGICVTGTIPPEPQALPTGRGQRVIIEQCEADPASAPPAITVSLRYGDRVEQVRLNVEGDIRLDAAEAVAQCLQRLLPGCEVDVPDIFVCGSLGVQEIVTAHVRLRLLGQEERRLVGAAPCLGDACRAVANAVMAAVNRPLALWLQAEAAGLGGVQVLSGRALLSEDHPREAGPHA